MTNATLRGCVAALALSAAVPSSGFAESVFRDFRADFTPGAETVDLSFSPGEKCELRVAYDADDQGASPSAWTNMTFVAIVSNDTTSLTYQVPEKWRTKTGSLRFFLSEMPTLPSGVSSRVQWIGKTNACNYKGYLDTGVVPTTDLTTRLTYWLPKTATGTGEEGLFGISGTYGMFTQSATLFWASFGASGTVAYYGYSYKGDAVHTVELGPEGLLFDGENKSGPVSLTETTVADTVPLFIRSKTDNEKGSCWLRIYEVKMTKGTEPVRDMYPCVANGKGALYDTVSKAVYPYTPVSGAELTVGPEWGAERPDGEAALASAAVRVARAITSISIEDGALHLTFSGDYGKDALYIARDTEDKGSDPSAWATVMCIGIVTNGQTTVDYAMPEAWQGQEVAYRAFLAPIRPHEKYDFLTEWIYKAKDQGIYVDSGIVPDCTTEIKTTFMLPSMTRGGSANIDVGLYGLGGKYAFACQSSRGFLSAFISGETTAYLSDFGYGASYGGDVRHTLEVTAAGLSLDGTIRKLTRDSSTVPITTPLLSDTTKVATNTMPILARCNDGSSKANKDGACYLYSFDIRKGGELVRRFRPCVKNGVAGLYDSVSNAVCFKAAGKMDLDAGPEWGPETPEGAVSASAPLRAVRTVAVKSLSREAGEVTLVFGGYAIDSLLYAVYDPRADRGAATPADWPSRVYLGKIAATTATATYGTDKLPAAWFRRGGALRFVLLSAANFPFDAQLDYLASTADGKQVIDTGICPDTNTVFSMRITRKPNDYAEWGTCIRDGQTTHYAMSGFLHSVGSGIAWTYFGRTGHATDTTLFKDEVECTYALRLGPDGLFFNDETTPRVGPFVGDLAPTFTEGNQQIYLFARNDGLGNASKNGYEFKLHRVTIDRGSERQRDFIPCSVGGKAKMYDRVTKAYFSDINVTGSPGIVDFVGGPEIAPDVTDAAYPAVSWSEPQWMEKRGLMLLVR